MIRLKCTSHGANGSTFSLLTVAIGMPSIEFSISPTNIHILHYHSLPKFVCIISVRWHVEAVRVTVGTLHENRSPDPIPTSSDSVRYADSRQLGGIVVAV